MMFWILAAMLAFVTVVVLIAPLLRPPGSARTAGLVSDLRGLERERAAGRLDAGEFEHARAGLARRLLALGEGSRPSRRAAMVLSGLVPVVALALYLPFGLPDLPSQPYESRQERMEAIVGTLQDHLGRNPEDVEGWLVLGQTLGHLGRTDEALDAYARAQSLAPEDAVWLDDLRERIARLAATP
jgi:cytochrome c-type biogenesis protein CcmH